MSANLEKEIHTFWFGTLEDDASVAEERRALWWEKDAANDRIIKQRFEDPVLQAASGGLSHLAGTPRGALTLILLTDQFTRTIYRDTPLAFACDPLALAWSGALIQSGDHLALRPVERVFAYLPLEHAEDLKAQENCVRLFRELEAAVPEQQRAAFSSFRDYADRHFDVIKRFGRFPHRNSILGRKSSPEEIAFLEEPNSSF